MLKRITSLLFEDDEEVRRRREEEEEDDDEEEVVVEAPRRREAFSAPAPEPEPEPQKPVMTRVEVTQAVPAQREEKPVSTAPAFGNGSSPFRRTSSVQHASPRPIAKEEPAPVFSRQPAQPTQQPAPSSFGISADGGIKKETGSRPVAAVRPAAAPRPAAQEQRRTSPAPARRPGSYEFRPVISPMFGVDEKDMNAMQYVATPAPAPVPEEAHVSTPVISPIYGAKQDTSMPTNPVDVEEPIEEAPIPRFDGSAYEPKPQPKDENTFPEFSLDDILSARDEEFTRQNIFENNDNDYRTPDIDETAVIDSSHYSSFDEKTLDFERERR